jgi:FtsZ-binding cell division protein ZapB
MADASGTNSLDQNAFQPGHLFGTGYEQYDALEIQKDIKDVINICHPKCMEDEKCSGFGYRIDDRYDGRPNGNCWFMTDEVKYVPIIDGGTNGGGVWIKFSENYLGCFRDAEIRDLGFRLEDNLSIDECIQGCGDDGYSFAGLQYSYICFCDNDIGMYGPASNCDIACSSGEGMCGGVWANSVYSTSMASGTFSELESSNSDLQVTISGLQATIDEFANRNSELQDTNNELATSNSELATRNSGLESGNSDLQVTISGLQDTNNELATRNDDLQDTNNKLATSNSEPAITNSELATSNDELQDTNNELATTIDELATRYSELAARNSELATRNSDLQDTILATICNLELVAPTSESTRSRIDVFEEIIAPYSSGVAIDGTPQRDALIWLADADPLQLPLNIELTQLLERYSLAVLYEATGGSGWESKGRWKSAAATCDWYRVYCDDGAIARLYSGKLNRTVVSHSVQSSNTNTLT